MITTRRIAAAIGLAAAVTGLVVPTANAAGTDSPDTGGRGSVLESLTTKGRTVEHNDVRSTNTAPEQGPDDGGPLKPVTGLLSPLLGGPAPS
ncbi:hypothetical protein [Streptomyces solaniscabiei]|uniref:hypothetical protein n=1 Tax=Streptomyces solaniscabiei TaxID=2683255 RepID=UPI001CE32616|nr:hypothetical protein [Streptomyces solaniscabiei]